jgi:hypothetical protein
LVNNPQDRSTHLADCPNWLANPPRWIMAVNITSICERYSDQFLNQSQKSALSYGLMEVSALNNEFWDGFLI